MNTSLGQSVYSVPSNLVANYVIWGSLSDTSSYLYYGIGTPNANAVGDSGGGNPMVVKGLGADPYYYIFFLGVASDNFSFGASNWRNVLLQARTQDFVTYQVQQSSAVGGATWTTYTNNITFNGAPDTNIQPALVVDSRGTGLVSNQTNGPNSTGGSMIGSIVNISGTYYYFYTDQDPSNASLNHLYYRTSTNITTNGTWSAPAIALDIPANILVRVAKAKGMNRWAVFYNCVRLGTAISDICLEYTDNMNVVGAGGISALTLFQGGPGFSSSYLGLIGKNSGINDGSYLKAQQFFMTDVNGNLTSPSSESQTYQNGGMLTWMDYPKVGNPFGAPVYWAEWTVQ